MTYSLDSKFPNVWLARDGAPIPENLDQLTGLLVVFEPNESYDFDIIYRVRLFVLSPRNTVFSNQLPAKMAFLRRKGEYSPPTTISWGAAEPQLLPHWLSFSAFQKDFCPLVLSLGNRRSYSKVIELLSAQVARKVILEANDIAALNEFKPASPLLHELRNSVRNLWAGFYREDEERFSFIEFARLFRRNELKSHSLAEVVGLDTNIRLWGDRFVIPLRLNFPTVLGQRQLQNVVIGPNGSGKSNLLLGLAKAILNKKEVSLINELGSSTPLLSTQIISLAVFTYDSTLWDQFKGKNIEIYQQGVQDNNWRQFSQIFYEISVLDEGRTDIRLFLEVVSGLIKVDDLHLTLHSDRKFKGNNSRNRSDVNLSISEIANSSADEFDQIMSNLDRSKPPIMRSLQNDYELSSGERSLVLFFIKLMQVAKKGSLILIDEPENHLHPRFITLMMQTLSRVLLATESRALLVTHSPFVVREFERSTVKVMKIVDGAPELFRPTMQTLGGDVSMIADHVFEDDTIKKGFEISIDRQLRNQSFHNQQQKMEWSKNISEELGEDALSYLFSKTKIFDKLGK